MQLSKWVASVAAAALIGIGVAVVADDATPGQPTPAVAEKPAKEPKVERPYSELPDLTDDQKAKIADIHKTELDAEKDLRAKEKADIMAVLTDKQKDELVAISAKLEAQRKAEAEARRAKAEEEKAQADKLKAENMPATMPAIPKP